MLFANGGLRNCLFLVMQRYSIGKPNLIEKCARLVVVADARRTEFLATLWGDGWLGLSDRRPDMYEVL